LIRPHSRQRSAAFSHGVLQNNNAFNANAINPLLRICSAKIFDEKTTA
jgi:hypothetical protein